MLHCPVRGSNLNPGARLFKFPSYVAEGYGFPEGGGKPAACNAANLLFSEKHLRTSFRYPVPVRNESKKMPVYMAPPLDPGYHFLTDVTPLLEIKGVPDAGLDGNSIVVHIDPVNGNAGFYPEYFQRTSACRLYSEIIPLLHQEPPDIRESVCEGVDIVTLFAGPPDFNHGYLPSGYRCYHVIEFVHRQVFLTNNFLENTCCVRTDNGNNTHAFSQIVYGRLVREPELFKELSDLRIQARLEIQQHRILFTVDPHIRNHPALYRENRGVHPFTLFELYDVVREHALKEFQMILTAETELPAV